MRLWIMSDLHLETRGRDFMEGQPQPDHDVVVLAGDVWRLRKGVDWAARTFAKPVVYVPGEGEFHDAFLFTELQAGIERAAASHVALLHDRSLSIGGVRFLGATLWSDFDLFGPERREKAMAACAERADDFRRIGFHMGYDPERGHYLYHPMTPADARDQHMISRAWLERELAYGDRLGRNDVTVVVTHHAPGRGSLAARRRHDLASAGDASDLGALIERYRPALWVHGHLHARHDYIVGATRIVANPLGFGWERTGFEPGLVIDLPFREAT